MSLSSQPPRTSLPLQASPTSPTSRTFKSPDSTTSQYAQFSSPPRPPLSDILPPLICGTATFNNQYNNDAYALPTTAIVHRALDAGIRAFDTSPYYGPAEELLGLALAGASVPRSSYHLLTKVGRINATTFDYSTAHVRASVHRSLARLRTPYLDVVYCHDAEFVTPTAVLAAVTELRRLRDHEAALRYVGVSGYPIDVLVALADLVLRTTGEPLDSVQSYAGFTLQSERLRAALPDFVAAGVAVVPNASLLGMGLLRREGPPVGGQGDWHPAPEGLRAAAKAASLYCEAADERIERVALRWALEHWTRDGAVVGAAGPWLGGERGSGERVGVSVIGVSNLAELEETIEEWWSVGDGLDGMMTPRDEDQRARSARRGGEVDERVVGVRERLGDWLDYAWASPGAAFLATRASAGEEIGG